MRGVVALEEADLVADRARLRKRLYEHPAWPRQEYADLIGRSLGWVKKWMKRLREAAPTDEAVERESLLYPQAPTASHQPGSHRAHFGDQRSPTRELTAHARSSGDPLLASAAISRSGLQAASSRARRARVFQILTQHGRIAHQPRRERVPMERPGPLAYWHLDWQRMLPRCRLIHWGNGNTWSKR